MLNLSIMPKDEEEHASSAYRVFDLKFRSLDEYNDINMAVTLSIYLQFKSNVTDIIIFSSRVVFLSCLLKNLFAELIRKKKNMIQGLRGGQETFNNYNRYV